MNIPNLIHQTGPEPIPAAYKPEWQQSWKDAHPAWAYTFYSDADLLALAEASYPDLAPIFAHADTPGVVRGDFGRLMALHHVGGVYADLDYACLKPLDALLAGKSLVISEMARRAVPVDSPPFLRHFHNALMAAEAGHPFLRAMLDAALVTWQAGEVRAAELIAGPEALRRCLRVYDGGDVYVSPPGELCPVSWRQVDAGGRDQYAAMSLDQLRAQFPDAYAVTFWLHQW